jgi:hypothetical protein
MDGQVRRGRVSFIDKVVRAQMAGAVGAGLGRVVALRPPLGHLTPDPPRG